MKNETLYPLKFYPILKQKIWGGTKLAKTLGKQSNAPNIGESWELSDVKNNTSIVSNGTLKNTPLNVLLEQQAEAILGVKNYKIFGTKFPLLIKFIDAKEDLSIQLHPNDKLAKDRHNSFGKTEMWHVLQADKDANLIVGFNQKVDKDKYLQHLENKSLIEILNFDNVQKGDAYFIEVGRVHAIGAGVMLAEIQQTSDITYRVYDWDRVDADGNERELHNHLALDAINFDLKNDFKVDYQKELNISNTMVKCQYFTTNYLHINTRIEKHNNYDSFIIYICTEGQLDVITDLGKETIHKGETLLIPACIQSFSLSANQAEVLEVYI